MSYKKVIEYRGLSEKIISSNRYIDNLKHMYDELKDVSFLKFIDDEEKLYNDYIYRKDILTFGFSKLLEKTDEPIIKHCIINYVFLGHTWEKVAESYGCPLAADSIRIRFRRFMEKVDFSFDT